MYYRLWSTCRLAVLKTLFGQRGCAHRILISKRRLLRLQHWGEEHLAIISNTTDPDIKFLSQLQIKDSKGTYWDNQQCTTKMEASSVCNEGGLLRKHCSLDQGIWQYTQQSKWNVVTTWWEVLGQGESEMRWDEMRWDEMRWDEMRWDEMRWDEMRWDEMRWDEMRWDEMRWDEVRWDEMRLLKVKCVWEQRAGGLWSFVYKCFPVLYHQLKARYYLRSPDVCSVAIARQVDNERLFALTNIHLDFQQGATAKFKIQEYA